MKNVKDIGPTSSCEIKLQPFEISRLAEHCSNAACWAIIYAIWFGSILVIWQILFGNTLASDICAEVYPVGAKTVCCRTASTTWFFHYFIRLKHVFKNGSRSPLVVSRDWSFLNRRVSVIYLQKGFSFLRWQQLPHANILFTR